jgi:hypothetical protein
MAALLAGGIVMATGCAPATRTTPPIRVAAPRISRTQIPLPPAEADGLAQFHEWPKACDLLTADDMKAVLPQITKVAESPQGQSIKIMNLAGGDGDAPDTACEIKFWVAGTEKKRLSRPDILRVEDIAVGDSATVKDNYDSLAHAKPKATGDLGALECVLDRDNYYCRMSNIAFSVSAGSTLYIASFVGQPKQTEARVYWVKTVMPDFVRSVASKLPRG